MEQRAGRTVRQGNRNHEVDIVRYVTEGTFDAYLYQLIENKQKFIAQVMTSRSPVRSADDIDETALSYAEIKALASGNPEIKEKMDLDIEVSRLQLLKGSYLSQKYELEDKIISYYPREIREINERIAGYDADIATVKDRTLPGESFSGMVLDGIKYTDKKEAGAKLMEACSRMSSPEAVKIGEYRGLSLELSFDIHSKEFKLALKGALTHTATLGMDVYGNIQRIDNVLSGLNDKLDILREKLETMKQQMETAKEEAKKPFLHESELAEKSERLAELNTLLDIDKKENEMAAEEPEEVYDDMSDKEKEYSMER